MTPHLIVLVKFLADLRNPEEHAPDGPQPHRRHAPPPADPSLAAAGPGLQPAFSIGLHAPSLLNPADGDLLPFARKTFVYGESKIPPSLPRSVEFQTGSATIYILPRLWQTRAAQNH